MPILNPQADKRDIFPVLFIFALAVFLRLAFISDYRNTGAFPLLEHSDSYSYFLWAKDISAGELSGAGAFMKWPLYAYFLGFFFKLFGDNAAVVYFFQYILGAVNCVAAYFIGKKIFDRRAGFIAGIFCSLYGLFIFYESLLVYVSLSLFLNSLLFLFILKIQHGPGRRNLFWLGIFLGICAITQASIIIFGIFAVLWILKKNSLALRNAARGLSFFILGLAAVIGSVTLRNYLAEKDFVLIAGNVGFNFYCGNNPKASGTFFCPSNIGLNQEDMFRDAVIMANNESGRRLTTRGASDFWFRKAASFILKEPVNYSKLFLRKLAVIFSPIEFIHDIEYHLIANKIRIFKVIFTDLKFILPAAFLGMLFSRKRFKDTAFLYMALVSLALGISLFFVSSRYRVTMVPYLAVFAGFGISSVWEKLRNKRFAILAGSFAFLSASFFLLNSFGARLEKGLSKNNDLILEAHFIKAIDYKNNSDYRNALDELEAVCRINPSEQRALFQAAVIYLRLNELKAAEEKFRQVIQVNPLSVDAYYDLGLMYNRQRRFFEAKEMLKRAVSLDPENAASHFELGVACKSLKEDICAGQEFAAALEKINRWRSAEREVIQKELDSLKVQGS